MKKLLFVLMSMFPSVSFADAVTGPYFDLKDGIDSYDVKAILLMAIDSPIITLSIFLVIIIVTVFIVRYYKNQKKNVNISN